MDAQHQNSISKTIHPGYLSIYAIFFLFFLLQYVSSVIYISIHSMYEKSVLEPKSLFSALVAFALMFQFLRMYYYLESFFLIKHADRREKKHFLELLNGGYALVDKCIRWILAGVLIGFSKILPNPHEMQNCEDILLGPLIILFLCFIALIIWDYNIWEGLKSNNNDKSNLNLAWQTARYFFYLNPSIKKPSALGSYFSEIKFLERSLGLASVLTGFYYIHVTNQKTGELLGWFVLTFPLMFFGLTLFGKYHSGESDKPKIYNFLKTIIIATGYNIAEVIGMPVYTILSIFDGEITVKRVKIDKKILSFCIVALALITLILMQYYFGNNQSGATIQTVEKINKTQTKMTHIRIATSKNLWCALTLIAYDKGYFQAESLDPELNIQAAGRLNMDALLGGAVDFANVVETNIAYQSLNDTRNLLVHGRIVSATDYAILTKATANIRSPQELNGKSIAYAQATGAESFVFWLLEKENISYSNVKLISLQPSGIVDHFLGGNSEAIATWEPFVSTIKNRSNNLGNIFYTDSTGFAGIMTVATHRDWAEMNPLAVEAYERAMLRSSQFAIR